MKNLIKYRVAAITMVVVLFFGFGSPNAFAGLFSGVLANKKQKEPATKKTEPAQMSLEQSDSEAVDSEAAPDVEVVALEENIQTPQDLSYAAGEASQSRELTTFAQVPRPTQNPNQISAAPRPTITERPALPPKNPNRRD